MPDLWTQADLNALKAAVASGVLSVTYAGPPARTVTYHSLESMRALLAEMNRQVNAGTSYRRARFRKGFDVVDE